MHFACESGSYELVKYLISLNLFDITTRTILAFKLMKFFLLFSFYFVSYYEKLMEFQKIFNITLLDYACLSGNLCLVKYILSFDQIDIASKTIIIYFLYSFFYICIIFQNNLLWDFQK